MIVASNEIDLDPTDFVLDIYEQLDACGQGHKVTSVDSEKEKLRTLSKDNTRSNLIYK